MLSAVSRFHDRTSELGLWVGMAALAGIATLSFVATMSRYFFGYPIGWTPDWSGYLLAGSVFAAAPAVTGRSMHVSMDVLAVYVGSIVIRRLLNAVATLLALAVLSVMSWIVWKSMVAAWDSGTGTAAAYSIPRWWLLSFVFYGFASSALHLLRTGLTPLVPSLGRTQTPSSIYGA